MSSADELPVAVRKRRAASTRRRWVTSRHVIVPRTGNVGEDGCQQRANTSGKAPEGSACRPPAVQYPLCLVLNDAQGNASGECDLGRYESLKASTAHRLPPPALRYLPVNVKRGVRHLRHVAGGRLSQICTASETHNRLQTFTRCIRNQEQTEGDKTRLLSHRAIPWFQQHIVSREEAIKRAAYCLHCGPLVGTLQVGSR
jgi:hypothetical protein